LYNDKEKFSLSTAAAYVIMFKLIEVAQIMTGNAVAVANILING